MARNRLEVVVAGDASPLERELGRAKGQLDRFGEFVRVRSRRASSVGLFRLGGVGLGPGSALFAATQGLHELSNALGVTGDQAFAAEGRLRNLGASLLSGDIIGGVKALAATPETLEDLGLDARGAAAHLDELRTASEAMGGSFTRIYEEAQRAAEGVRELDAATRAALESTLGLTDAQGRVVAGGLAGQQPGFQAPLPRFGTPTGSVSPAERLELQARRAQRAGDLPAQLGIAKKQADVAHRRVQIVRDPGSALAVERRSEYEDALDRVDRIEDQIAAEKQRAAEEEAREARARAAEARRRAAEAKRRREQAERERRDAIEDAIRSQEKLRDALTERTERFRDSALEAIDRKLAKRSIERDIGEKQEQLQLALRLGGPSAIKQAREELGDAKLEQARLAIEHAKITPISEAKFGGIRGPGAEGFNVQTMNLHLHGVNDIHELIRQLQRIGNTSPSQRSGRYAGRRAGL